MFELPPETVVRPSICAILLVLIPLFIRRLDLLDMLSRSRWLSFAGGASAAFVFVHVFPELSEGSRTIQQADPFYVVAEQHVYVVALAGFTMFYGLEQYVKNSSRYLGGRQNGQTNAGTFWVQLGPFAFYSCLIGYLLFNRHQPGLDSLIFFAIAMGLHFMETDYGLREIHSELYDRVGRWILAIATAVGAIIGFFVKFDDVVIALLFAFLAGSVVLNVTREGLPGEHKIRFRAFLTGGTVYTVLLLLSGL